MSLKNWKTNPSPPFPRQEFTYPDYQGGSIVNLPDTVCGWFDLPPLGTGRLRDDLAPSPEEGIQNIILIIVDALSYEHFCRWTETTASEYWGPLLNRGELHPITSIAPSTTCAAITSLWTGQPAVRHGISGYEMWLKEYQLSANMIRHSPAVFSGSSPSLEGAGFEPETFLPLPTLGTHLRDQAVAPHVFQHRSIINSGLSRTFLRDVDRHGIHTSSEMMISIRELIEAEPEQRHYLVGYWGNIDTLFHLFGTEGPRPEAEFLDFSRHVKEYLIDALDPASSGSSLLVITADHGQITTPHRDHYNLADHPALADMLHMLPTGENRLAYLYVRPGCLTAVREYIQDQWPDQFLVMESREATEKGLFGPPPPHPDWGDRTGDLIMIARGKAYLWWPRVKNPLLGRHGGLSPAEMTVPLFTLRI